MTEEDPRPAESPAPAWFDSHAHFGHLPTPGERDTVLDRAVAAGVRQMASIGGSETENEAALDLAARHPDRVFAAVGWDRVEAARAPDASAIRDLLRRPGVAAIGETGLDYHYDRDSAANQRRLFEAMLALAREARLPVVVHTREADGDTLSILSDHASAWPGPADRIGVMHCFTGAWPFARKLLDLGFHLSFSGIASFPNAEEIRSVAARTPDDRLLIETDSPYLAPIPFRGRTNEPVYLPAVAAAIAAARNEPPEAVAEITHRNAAFLFGPSAGS